LERLKNLHQNYNLQRVIITNSIPQTKDFLDLPFLEVRCLSDPLCTIINRIHYNQSVSEAFYRE
jgi:phosphoribosylpyrophosphate synthetase